MEDTRKKLIEVNNLKKYFKVGKGTLKAVDGINLFIREGETLGLVGESGCGKSTAGRTIIRLYDATEGEVLFDGQDVHKFDKKQALDFTKKAQMIYQLIGAT